MVRALAGRTPSLLVAFAIAAAGLVPAGAWAQHDDEEVGGYAVVIQNRKYTMGHEFSLQGGILPLDAFYKGFTGTGRYTLHINDFHAWEVGGTFSLNIDTDLRQQLRENFGVQPDARGLEQIYGYVETNYVMKPIYGKNSLFNRFLIYNELYFTVGAAVGVWTDLSFRPGPGYGAGIRFFVFDWLSLRFDLRHYVLLNGLLFVDPNARLENLLYVGGGLSFNFFSSLLG